MAKGDVKERAISQDDFCRIRVVAEDTVNLIVSGYNIDSRTSGGASAYLSGSIEYDARP